MSAVCGFALLAFLSFGQFFGRRGIFVGIFKGWYIPHWGDVLDAWCICKQQGELMAIVCSPRTLDTVVTRRSLLTIRGI